MINVDYSFDDAEIQGQLSELQALGFDMKKITRSIAAVLASESETAFETETDINSGKKWPQLTPKYKARLDKKGKTGKMLQRSMAGLAQSMQLDYDAVSAVIGSNKVYAAIHQWGGLPSMPPAPAAVPARAYMGLSKEGKVDIVEIIHTTLHNTINGK